MIVPERPEDLLVEFLPRYFAGLAEAPGSEGGARGGGQRVPAPVGVVVRVVGAGEWTLRILSGKLDVSAGVAPDVALQLSLHASDFGPLVVTPLRRAGAPSGALPNGFWARLGRWDEETVDLVRRQEGRILVRVDDFGTSRNVAITPGLLPYSLSEAPCIIECRLADLEELQARTANPLDLFYAGQIRITGDAQIALAMAGLFL